MEYKEIEDKMIFERGEKNPFGQYFIGQSYLKMLTTEGVSVGNVTFEPRCRNNWHIHHASKGGGQILLCIAGEGWYQMVLPFINRSSWRRNIKRMV